MDERRSRSLSPEQKVQDKSLKTQKGAYAARVRPLVESVLSEDSYIQEELKSLGIQQREVLFRVIADHTALRKFGRTSREDTYVIHRRMGSDQGVDPVMNSYSRRLRRVGIDPRDYSGRFNSLAETIEIAANMDPLFDLTS